MPSAGVLSAKSSVKSAFFPANLLETGNLTVPDGKRQLLSGAFFVNKGLM
ncbi:hypothetical protein BN3661_01836 [Eubacteriaceae bacterium CHKCI005]|nr:hypothetical protein BN3661_01836 [Eubacteriaceae bacterium CHKCI005]